MQRAASFDEKFRFPVFRPMFHVPPGPGSPGLKHSYSLLATLLPGRSVNSDSAQPGPVGGVTMAA